MTAYCNNDPCDREATHFYTTDKGAKFFLCGFCHDAFELGQVNSDKDTSSVDDIELTVAQINFFEAEIRNEQSGGVLPATLDSAFESLEQAPNDIIVGWADDDTVNDDTVCDFVESIENLRNDLGGDTTLDSLLPILDNDDAIADSIAEHERAIHNNPDER